MTVLPLDAIKIGKRRRADLGDIKQLAHNIAEIGLLHPIVVTSDKTLVAGTRRIMAFKALGRMIIGGEARHKIAKAAGKSAPSIAKARAVRDAAKAGPEKFGKLQADMDRTGRVDGPFKRLKVMRQAIAICAEPPPLPGRGPYRVLVADPPWPYEIRKDDPSHRATHLSRKCRSRKFAR
jgi:ParB-like nuclease domain